MTPDTFTNVFPGPPKIFELSFDSGLIRIYAPKTCIDSHQFKRIQEIPCLILWGQYDNLIPMDPNYEKFKHELPKAHCRMIKDAGHAPFAEKTVTVYELIRKFMMNNHA